MRFGILIIFTLLGLLACSDDNNNPTYPFERTVLEVSIAKKCKDCYLMRWNHPIEKKDLQNYYVWLDTTVVKDSDQKVSQQQINLADKAIAYKVNSDGDSLDLTNLIGQYLNRDSLHIAIWAKYSGNDQGVVQHLYLHFGDDVRPSVISFRDSASANTIWIDWIRPTDQSDFYEPNIINGPIAGYNVSIRAETNSMENIGNARINISLAGNFINPNFRRWQRFTKDGRGVKLESINSELGSLRFAIIDGKGFVDDDNLSNKWEMKIEDLKPEHSYTITITAYDSSGNSSIGEPKTVKTTDSRAPGIADKFWYYRNSEDNLARLDSNRLVLFWIRSLDTLDNGKFNSVRGYSIEQMNNNAWEIIPRAYAIRGDYYNTRYTLRNDSMIFDPDGAYISDTLRWVLPGETVTLRMWAIDSSGHYSKEMRESIAVSKGALWQYSCPPNFAPVQIGEEEVFCMEKLQYNSGGRFEKNILYNDAKDKCENFGYRLCKEKEWDAACSSRNSNYGVIEEKNESGLFSPSEFLYSYCGVGTGISDSSAIYVNKRNKICASPDGIRDLPGQLQEWVAGNEGTPLLKGSSYAIFQGASRVELAQCKNRFTPTRIRPRYTTDSVYLYRTGSRIDTLRARDTLRTLYAILKPDSLPDTLLFYALKKTETGNVLGLDYVNQAEYRKRGEDKWLKVLWQGLFYEFKEHKQVLIMGDTAINASNFFLDPTVGFRCCTDPSN